MVEKYTAYYKSKIGYIKILSTKSNILSVNFVKTKKGKNSDIRILKQCLKQLDEYFRGHRRKFSVDIALYGTDFQKSVWRQLQKIPFAHTVSYKDIARAIRNKNAVRAVGSANNKNKIVIIVPCHRVIGSDGKLVGYGGGLWRKKWLLSHEKNVRSTRYSRKPAG
ncbi:cysteine methyltransferase [candidate division TA06 bacterium DG_78]|uniref:Methylated-DNA--protein-cysteine methyltransferase n=1 Tax=candidate division TA06 bacterium DG_78 TaxID=1703772 RepID=A0A0S7YH87_UNCT6|nr:MAG: cysteine methyltransferase [candidate division TA06 bacterium DG_78]